MQLDYTLCTTSLARIFGKTPTEVNRLQMEYTIDILDCSPSIVVC